MMQLIFEKSVPGRGFDLVPAPALPVPELPEALRRKTAPRLPQVSQVQIARHYRALEKRCYGVNDGFYPLGSCTMKYNPAFHEAAAAQEGFAQVHPLQPKHTVEGCLSVYREAGEMLSDITGMDAMTFEPAAGAHGEWTGLLLIRAYHKARGDAGRTKMLIPDAAHGTNPASAVLAGFEVVTIPSDAKGCVDLAALREAAGPDTAGLMLTNPNTLGLFDSNILEITDIVHQAGGLNYYDGANLNAIMGITRPGDMGFDVVHLNLHKTFSTPHGGGGPGSGPVGCKALLTPYLPEPPFAPENPASCGSVKAFWGNFAVVVKALCYLKTLGREGIPAAAGHAVLHANYLQQRLKEAGYTLAYDDVLCMHEFVVTLEPEKERHGVSALDIAKAMLDAGMHAPTMYFPLIVHEALMFEPTETETKEMLDEAVTVLTGLLRQARENPQALHDAPVTTPIGRPDEVLAARNPVLIYDFPEAEV